MKNKIIPVNKMSKKMQKDIAKKKRGSWLGINPVTRVNRNTKKDALERIKKEEMKKCSF